MSDNIRDRVTELVRVRAGDLVPHPTNWRTHPPEQRAAYEGMLREVGIANAVIVYRLDDGRYQLIDGHMRQEQDPDMMLPALVLDVNEHEAGLLLGTMDPIGAMAGSDREALAKLLDGINTGEAAVQEMLAGLAA